MGWLPSTDLIDAVGASNHVKVRSLLRAGHKPGEAEGGITPLSLAIEKADIACVAMLLSSGASPDASAAPKALTGRQVAHRMIAGEHACRRIGQGKRAGVIMLRLINEPRGEEVRLLNIAFDQRLDALELEEKRQRSAAVFAVSMLVVILLALHVSGVLDLISIDQREL